MAGARLTYEQRWKRLRKYLRAKEAEYRAEAYSETITDRFDRGYFLGLAHMASNAIQHDDLISRPQPRKETRR